MKRIIGLFVTFAFALSVRTASATDVDNVDPGITGANHTDSTLFAKGYFNPGDGGGGWFVPTNTSCSFTRTGSYHMSSNIVSLSDTSGIVVGMGIGDPVNSTVKIPTGTTVTNVTPTSVTMSAPAGGDGTQVVLGGGNGGTLIGDFTDKNNASHCYARVSTSWSAREWGAKCDVVVPDANVVWDPTNSSQLKIQNLKLPSASGTIVVPGIGVGPYSTMGNVARGSSITGSMQTGYTSGEVVTFGTTNSIQVMVDSASGGVIQIWHFLNYLTLSSGLPTSLSQSAGAGSGATLNLGWSGATFVGTIGTVSISGSDTIISLTGTAPALPIARTVNSGWYFGDDDGAALNNALNNIVTPPLAMGAAQLNLPGNCGTTIQINAPTTLQNNPALVGLGQSSSGLYALGPITGNVFNRSSTNTANAGGGLSNMTVEAMGLTTDGSGHGSPVVAISGGKSQTFSNLEVRDAVGSLLATTGNLNAVFRCGSDTDSSADAGDNIYQNIRAETDQSLFSGAQFPDADFDAAGHCHDSRLYSITGNNAVVANLMHVGGGGLHIDHAHTFNAFYPDVYGSPMYGIVSGQHDYIVGAQIDDARFAGLFLAPNINGASNGQRAIETWVDCGNLKEPAAGAPAPFTLNTTGSALAHSTTLTLTTSPTGPTAGMAISGIGIPVGDTIFSISGSTITLVVQTGAAISSGNITITDGYRGVEISDGDYGAAVTATSDEPKCHMFDSAIIQQDGTASPSTAVFANSHASYSTIPTIYSGSLNLAPQGRLTLSSGQAVMTGDVTGATAVYYAPYTGTFVPIYNGVNVQMYKFATDQIGLTLPLSSGTHTGGHLYDVFVFSVGGVITLGTGPQWTNTTTRSVSPHFFQGLWTNPSSMTVSYGSPIATYSCPQDQCTYVGTVYITTDGHTCMQFQPAAAAGGVSTCGTGAFAGLWNAYNRVPAHIRIKDSNGPWNAASINWEAADIGYTGSNYNNRINFVDGQQVEPAHVTLDENNQSNGSSSTKPLIGVQFDSTASTPGPDIACKQQANQIINVGCEAFNTPLLGLHYAQAMEQAAASGTGTPFGSGLVTSLDWDY